MRTDFSGSQSRSMDESGNDLAISRAEWYRHAMTGTLIANPDSNRSYFEGRSSSYNPNDPCWYGQTPAPTDLLRQANSPISNMDGISFKECLINSFPTHPPKSLHWLAPNTVCTSVTTRTIPIIKSSCKKAPQSRANKRPSRTKRISRQPQQSGHQPSPTCRKFFMECHHHDDSVVVQTVGSTAASASSERGRDIDKAPDRKQIKLHPACDPCAKAFKRCDRLDSSVAGSMCKRCLNSVGEFHCVYSYTEPPAISRCDTCRKAGRTCEQTKSCPDCTGTNTIPCIHRSCDRCSRLEKECVWSGAEERRDLIDLYRSLPVFKAVGGEKTQVNSRNDEEGNGERGDEEERS
jgi:hypothetical protein